ncbi:MAG: hypothetical protein M1511_11370 [Deltaproteobacteria bacterium]|nr:hypothetical protein [Deltaproteobacteria bacterium]
MKREIGRFPLWWAGWLLPEPSVGRPWILHNRLSIAWRHESANHFPSPVCYDELMEVMKGPGFKPVIL